MAVGYQCRGCGIIRSEPWQGACANPHCGRWYNWKRTNVHEEDVPGAQVGATVDGEAVSLCDVTTFDVQRISVGIPSVDRILGGDEQNGYGVVKEFGQIVMLYSNPGLGKSTLLLQWCRHIAAQRFSVLYVAGEESLSQIKARADRIGKFNSRMLIVNETQLDAILDLVDENAPTVLVIDSGQTVRTDDFAPGSPNAINALGTELKDLCKREKIVAIVIVHVTKDGEFSGPKTFEHYVDTSLRLDGNPKKAERTLHPVKNRFCPPGIEARLRMTDKGFVEVIEAPEVEPEPAPDLVATAKPKKPPVDPVTAWRGKGGITAPIVLAVACEEPECRGAVDRACTAENGAREVGFHPSRVEKARATVATKKPKKARPKLELVPPERVS